MKQFPIKRFALAAFLLTAAPVTLLAQPEKEKEKTKEKTERQQIVITRNGDKSEKTVIEIDGDKVKVNGKDVADLKDIQVKVNNWTAANAMTFRTPAQGNFSMVYDDNQNRLYSTDSNRAMLGVVTEGDDKGVAIQSVSKESAAEKAGLKKGDVITKIDSRKIEATGDVTDAIRAHKPGNKVTVTYLRDGKEQKATAELGRWKGIDVKGMTATTPKVLTEDMWRNNGNTFERLPSMQGSVFSSFNRPRLGMAVQDTDDGKGVKVLEIEEEGTAAKAGMKKDDIIMQVDDKAVNSADEVSKLMKEKKDQPIVRMQVNRGGKMQTVEVKIPRKLKTVDL